ncbi:hypothetical protein I302_102219 [Kwoniella bestiolae CBS 10118]|uniref:Uncharacterized protein n=1 Tax=Kwoniella bestiolae CBS 10118 TaxID=1296100 RepID=A0AAJ8K3A0_9TREE
MASINVSVRTAALLALSQDICALISLTMEATLSVCNFMYRFFLGLLGYERPVKFDYSRGLRRESGRGCGVVVLGANEAAGQSLTLHLAKIGYTVFPLIPLPSPSSPPTSSALTHLLLTWSGVQKRLRARYPGHQGAVVPVIIDPEGISGDLSTSARGDLKKAQSPVEMEEGGEGRFSHAGETVRAYCKENKLTLVSIVCINRKVKSLPSKAPPQDFSRFSRGTSRDYVNTLAPQVSPVAMQRSSSAPSSPSNLAGQGQTSTATTTKEAASKPVAGQPAPSSTSGKLPPLPTLPASSLITTDEQTMISLYRSNILDPLAIIKELSDLLSVSFLRGYSKGRVVFISGEGDGRIVELNDQKDEDDWKWDYHNYENSEREYEEPEYYRTERRVVRFVDGIKRDMFGVIRGELGRVGVDVCEVVVGPMSPRIGTTGYHLRHSSEDSNEGASAILGDTLPRRRSSSNPMLRPAATVKRMREAAVSSELRLLTRLWAVDDALLFSSVRRAIEDFYVRPIHRAGLSPWVEELLGWVPWKIGYISRDVGREVLKVGLEFEWMIRQWARQIAK